ncbi:hypothetical protein Ddye_006015 [Dipteronia dyeriana]|uniref:Uncharacterized protein n=1 Tax=Dipteronia dyeriana TaxID=168575 RepID=A0AAD9XHL8_9ROSI|nr:hypothetical protein Ddye_006015 [Dipteronia dyeriana]
MQQLNSFCSTARSVQTCRLADKIVQFGRKPGDTPETVNFFLRQKRYGLRRRATKGAKTEVRLHDSVTETAPQSIGRVSSRLREMRRKKEIAVVAKHERIFGRPFPHWNEEELQDLIIFDQIGA